MSRLFGVGVGPGDPELVTLKAVRLLARVPVIAYPAPEHGESFARRIAAPHLPGGQIEIEMRMPMTADRFPEAAVYDRAAADIADHLGAGREVAVLCEGDPLFYGSFMYLYGRMAERHPVEVIPGVSSLAACAAALGMPLVGRNDVLTVVPAPLPEQVLADRLAATDAAAIVKLARHVPKVLRVLDRLGLEGRARYVERASLDTQARRPLSALAAAPDQVPYFSMILVHRPDGVFR